MKNKLTTLLTAQCKGTVLAASDRIRFILLSTTTMLMGTVMIGCSGDSQEPLSHQAFAGQLRTVVAESATVPHVIEVPGTVRSKIQSRISPEIMGRISQQNLRLGQKVESGEILFVIDAPEVEARLEQARINLEQAKRDLAREESLLGQGAATSVGIRALQDRVSASRAQYQEAAAVLAKAKVTAPFTGFVSRIFSDVGDLASPGQPVIEFDSVNHLEIESAIPASVVGSIRPGDTLEVSIGQQRMAAKVIELSNRADSASRTVPIRLGLPEGQQWMPGQFARIHLETSGRERVLLPSETIRRFGQMDQVFVVENGNARMRLVRLGNRLDEHVEIIAGLSGGEEVVVAPPATLRSGQPVTVGN